MKPPRALNRSPTDSVCKILILHGLDYESDNLSLPKSFQNMREDMFQIGFFDSAFIADPYPVYDRLREKGALHSVAPGVWLITRYEDAVNALRDNRLSNQPAPFALVNAKHRSTFIAADIAQHLIAFRDPPDSIQPRRLLAGEIQAFCRGREQLFLDLAAELVTSVRPDTSFDFVETIAVPFAVRAMCRIFGFPETDADRLKAWSTLFFHMFHSIPDRQTQRRMNAALGEFRSYVRKAVAARRTEVEDGLISILLRADQDALDDDSLEDNIMLLVADAIENVWAGIASALTILIENRAVVDEFLANSGSWTRLVDECLRLESPGQYQGRIVTEPMEIDGTTLKKYQLVLVGLAAANRDPAVFDEPAAFLPTRKGPHHLAFGLGQHACIGGTLVLMEMTAILSTFWPLVARLEVLEYPLSWEARAGHRWLRALPLRLRS